MTEPAEQTSSHLTEACWPVFECLTNLVRKVKAGDAPEPEQVRREALSALREAEDLARKEPTCDRAWNEQIEEIMVYMTDYCTNWLPYHRGI